MLKNYVSDAGLAEHGIPIPVATLRKWRFEGRGPKYYKLSRRIYYDPAEVRAWIEARAVTPEK